jgi:hypothetical protein
MATILRHLHIVIEIIATSVIVEATFPAIQSVITTSIHGLSGQIGNQTEVPGIPAKGGAIMVYTKNQKPIPINLFIQVKVRIFFLKA